MTAGQGRLWCGNERDEGEMKVKECTGRQIEGTAITEDQGNKKKNVVWGKNGVNARIKKLWRLTCMGNLRKREEETTTKKQMNVKECTGKYKEVQQ